MPIKKGVSVTEELLKLDEELDEKEEPIANTVKLDLLDDLEYINKIEPESDPNPEPEGIPEPVRPVEPKERTFDEFIHEEKPTPPPKVVIREKTKKPKATGHIAQRDLDLRNMSTGMLSEMAGRDLVSGDKYRKKNKMIKWLVVILLLCGAGGGYYFWTTQNTQTDTEQEIANIQAQKKALEDKLKDLEKSEEYLKEELQGYMKNKAYNRAIQLANRIHNEYPDTETDKFAQKQADEARKALEKLGIPESTENDKLNVNYEDFKSVSYDKLASNSKNYRGNKVKIYGKVLQMEDGKDEKITVIRVAVDDDMSKQVVAQYEKSNSINIKEGDYVNVGGIVVPDLTFKTALGQTTMPAMSAVYVDRIVD